MSYTHTIRLRLARSGLVPGGAAMLRRVATYFLDPGRGTRVVAANLALAVVYMAVGRASLAAATEHRAVSSIWPAAGIAFFALVRYGVRLWPGVALGAYLVNTSNGIPTIGSLMIASGEVLEAIAGALLVRRLADFRRSLDRVRDVVALTALAGTISTLVAATIGVTTLVVTGSTSVASAESLWLVWWTGDAVGVLVMAPLLLVWTTPQRALPARRWQRTETMLSFVTVALVTDSLFAQWGMVVYAVYPLGIWLAWRFGPRGAATVVAMVTLIAALRTLSGYGPFTSFGPTANLFSLQLFLALFAVTSLLFAAAHAEARESDARLRASEARYRMLAQHLPDGCVVLYDDALRLLLVEGPAVAKAGFAKADVEGRTLDEVLEPVRAMELGEHLRAAIRGQVREFEFPYRGRAYLARVLPLSDAQSATPLGMALALDITQRESAQREIARSREQLERLSRLLLTAQEDERRHIAREVHDELGQALTAVKIGLAGTFHRPQRNSLDSERRVRVASATLDNAIESVKRIVLRLRPGVLDNLGPLAALEYEVQQFRERTNLEVTLDLPPEPLPADGARSTALYRTLQESLTNIMRHAHARRVDVSLVALERDLVLRVTDDGCGIGDEEVRNPRSMGILGMRERAAACGGRLELMRVRDGGTCVTLTIPRVARDGEAT